MPASSDQPNRSLRVPPRYGGGPLLNDLGEVVGILSIEDHAGQTAEETCFAQMVDALESLRAAAGFNPRLG